MMIHEIIDYDLGIRISSPENFSLCHIFFDSREEALEYQNKFRRRQCLYLCREWGEESLRNLWVEDRRKYRVQ